MRFHFLVVENRKYLRSFLIGLAGIFILVAVEWQSSFRVSDQSEVFLSGDHQSIVAQVGQHLVMNSPARVAPVRFSFQIISNDEMKNAFTMPGGGVYISRGLYRRLSNEGELAAILSHEIAHILLNHSQNSAVINDQSGEEPEWNGSSASPSDLESLAQLRQNELQADFLGMCIMQEAGYDPRDMVAAIEVLKSIRDPQTRLPERWSTHPDPDYRLEQVSENLDRLSSCP